jgi:O-antigen ligase
MQMINLFERQFKKIKINFKIFDFLNQVVLVLIGIFIFFNPFPYTTAIKEISFYLSLAFVLVLVIFKKTEFSLRTPLSLPFKFFVLWAFIGIFFALNKKNTIHDFYAHLIKYIICYYIIVNFFCSKKRLVGLSWIIIISSTIFSAGGLLYFFLILGKSLSSRIVILGEYPLNVIGIIAGTSIFFVLNQLYTEKYFYLRATLIFCLLPPLGLIIAGQLRSTFLGLFLAGFFFFRNNKKKLFVFLGLILAVTVTTPIKNRFNLTGINGILDNERFNDYYITYEIIKEHPIIGIGFGLETYRGLDLEKYNNRLPEKLQSKLLIADPHNLILDVCVRVGIVGLAFFLYILFVFLKMCWDIIKYGKDDFIKNWGRCFLAIFVLFFVIGFLQPVFSHVPENILCVIFSSVTVLWRFNNDLIKAVD